MAPRTPFADPRPVVPVLALSAFSGAGHVQVAPVPTAAVHDTVFHVSTPETLSYVDAKVENLLADDAVPVERVAVVVDSGRTIDAAATDERRSVERVLDAGGAVRVCSNALRGAAAGLADLPDGVERATSGVGELTRLQSEGYVYVRP